MNAERQEAKRMTPLRKKAGEVWSMARFAWGESYPDKSQSAIAVIQVAFEEIEASALKEAREEAEADKAKLIKALESIKLGHFMLVEALDWAMQYVDRGMVAAKLPLSGPISYEIEAQKRDGAASVLVREKNFLAEMKRKEKATDAPS